MRPPLSSPNRTSATLSVFPLRRGAPALWLSLWPSSGPVPTSFVCWGAQAGHSTPDGASWGQSRVGQIPSIFLLATPFDAALDTVGLPGCQWTLLAHIKLLILHRTTNSIKLILMIFSNSFQPGHFCNTVILHIFKSWSVFLKPALCTQCYLHNHYGRNPSCRS